MVLSMKPFINADAEETKVLSRPKSRKNASHTIKAANLSSQCSMVGTILLKSTAVPVLSTLLK